MSHINCRNCNQPNPDIALVCRYCGHALRPEAGARRAGYAEPQVGGYVPTHDWASSAPLPVAPVYVAPQPQPAVNAENFRCPFCQTTAAPVVATRISTGGWVVFAALLVACLPLCFLGLFIKEEYRMCSWCRASLS